MASISSAVFGPFRRTFSYLQRSAHEQPVVFFSLIIGSLGPAAVAFVPPIRKRYGYKPAERIPTSYPLPDRARKEVSGYDDQ